MRQRAEIDRRLAQLKVTITVLNGLLHESPKIEDDPTTIGDLGITDAIRRILSRTTLEMTPAQIKMRLGEEGFDLSKSSNSSAVIHNTLKRLESQKEIKAVMTDSGDIAFQITGDGNLSGMQAMQAMIDAAAKELTVASQVRTELMKAGLDEVKKDWKKATEVALSRNKEGSKQ